MTDDTKLDAEMRLLYHDNLDTHRTASVFVKRHGDGAHVEGAMRADEIVGEGRPGRLRCVEETR